MIFKTLIAYSILLICGGLFGYFRVGSIMSLIASVAAGAGLMTSAYTLEDSRHAVKIALGILFVLLVFFGLRWWWGGSFIPSGLMTLLTIIPFGMVLYGMICNKCP